MGDMPYLLTFILLTLIDFFIKLIIKIIDHSFITNICDLVPLYTLQNKGSGIHIIPKFLELLFFSQFIIIILSIFT